jgi:hypothetical protein
VAGGATVRLNTSQPGNVVPDPGQLAGFESKNGPPCQLVPELYETEPVVGVAAHPAIGIHKANNATPRETDQRVITHLLSGEAAHPGSGAQ